MNRHSEPFNAADYLDTPEAVEEFIAAAFEEGDAAFIARSLGVVARSRNLAALAETVGLSASELQQALSGEANPDFATVIKVLDALGIRLSARISKTSKSAA